MPTNFSVNIDPSAVLGVPADAPLQEIRDAYRAKAKRYHPDAGGEDWAFRILAQAYEILSTARVTRATIREAGVWGAAAPPPQPPPFTPEPSPFTAEPPPFKPQARPTSAGETVRPGVRDEAADPSLVVDVERLTVRYEVGHVWLISAHSAAERTLSCCLNVTWPDPALGADPSSIPGAENILIALNNVVNALNVMSQATSVRAAEVDGRFSGWLSYPNPERADAAFDQLHQTLNDTGLAVKQWSRDLVIPRPQR